MDLKPGKTGKVYLQPQKSGRKWKPVWMTLVPPSSSGVGRLEIQSLGGTIGEHGLRRPQALGERKPKVVRLSELLNVLRLPPNAEACPMENMCAFCVETQERTLVFAALKDDCAEWVDCLCQNTFQKSNVPEIKPQMEENAIYASADEVSDFRVTLQKTDAATRCGLQGAYWLKVDREALLLKDSQRGTVQEWPYELLRRYGRDKGSLSIETGRRCDCGPGTFIFETLQAETIFSLIQFTIKRKTTHTAPPGGHSVEVDKSITLNRQAHSPLPRTPEVNSMSAIFENKLKMDNEEAASSQPAPITLMPLPSLPKQETRSKSFIDNVYADPHDCLQTPVASKALYVDPASILPLKPPVNVELSQTRQNSVYAEVFDKVGVDRSREKFRDDDHIYSEPVKGEAKEEEKEKEVEKKADPFAHLYAQVYKRSTSPQPRAGEKEREEKEREEREREEKQREEREREEKQREEREREEKEREVEKKADPFAHLYAQVYKRSTSPQPRAGEKEREEKEREEREREEKQREEREREEKEREVEKKADPFAHLYAQVCKTNKRSMSPQPRVGEKQKEEKEGEEKQREEREREEREKEVDDVIYENLGII